MKFAGHRGIGSPKMVGVGYVQRELCDGQSLESPGRWPPSSRVYPSSTAWSSQSGIVSGVSRLIMEPKNCWSISQWER